MEKEKFNPIKYKTEYAKQNYKRLVADIKPSDFTMIDNFCKSQNISKAHFIVSACKYIIDNNIKV